MCYHILTFEGLSYIKEEIKQVSIDPKQTRLHQLWLTDKCFLKHLKSVFLHIRPDLEFNVTAPALLEHDIEEKV